LVLKWTTLWRWLNRQRCGELKDIFALQDSVTQKIVSALSPKLAAGEQSASGRPQTASVEAHDLLLRGLAVKLNPQKETNPTARRMFQAAIELDPNYANAYAWLAWSYADEWTLLWSEDPDVLDRAINAERRAIALDASLAEAHRALG
jgi:adenylate cyclase